MKLPLPTPIASGEMPNRFQVSYVYQGFDADGDLLYVGVTDDLAMRIGDHRRVRAEWIYLAVTITWEMFQLREDANRVEHHLIRTLQPRFNRADNGLRLKAADMGHRFHHDRDSWQRLGQVIRRERGLMRITQTALAREARLDVSIVRSLECCNAVAYPADVLEQMESALTWHPGSLEEILAGGEPDRLTDAERAERARAAAHARFAGAR
jgi:predicted GIY-YIG superfamily endonuclease